MLKNADFLLDLGAVFIAWVGKDQQLTNSAVLKGRQHFFVYQVFETDRSRCARPFLECVTLGRADFSCSIRMMLVMEGARKEKKGLESLFDIEKSCQFVKIACSDSVRRLYGLCDL